LFGNYRAYLRQIDNERLKNFESDCVVKAKTLNGHQFSGRVLSVEEKSIILCPDSVTTANTFSFLKSYTILNVKDIDSVQLETEYFDEVIASVGMGTAFGSIAGLVIGLVASNNYHSSANSWFSSDETVLLNIIEGVGLGAIVGASAGLVVGLITASSEETIDIRSASDLERFKEYLQYQYEKNK